MSQRIRPTENVGSSPTVHLRWRADTLAACALQTTLNHIRSLRNSTPLTILLRNHERETAAIAEPLTFTRSPRLFDSAGSRGYARSRAMAISFKSKRVLRVAERALLAASPLGRRRSGYSCVRSFSRVPAGPCLPAEDGRDLRTVEVQFLDGLAGLHFVFEVTPRQGHVAPAEFVADAGHQLHCEP